MGILQHKPGSFGTHASQVPVRSVVQVSNGKRIRNPSAHPGYSITNAETRLQIPLMGMPITNVPVIANLHDNSGVGTFLQMISAGATRVSPPGSTSSSAASSTTTSANYSSSRTTADMDIIQIEEKVEIKSATASTSPRTIVPSSSSGGAVAAPVPVMKTDVENNNASKVVGAKDTAGASIVVEEVTSTQELQDESAAGTSMFLEKTENIFQDGLYQVQQVSHEKTVSLW